MSQPPTPANQALAAARRFHQLARETAYTARLLQRQGDHARADRHVECQISLLAMAGYQTGKAHGALQQQAQAA